MSGSSRDVASVAFAELSPTANADLIWTKAKAIAADNAAAAALADAASAKYVTQDGSGAVQRTQAQAASQVIWPEDFNAIGDGATSDLAAIQAALDASRDHRKPVALKPRPYRIARMVTIHAGLELVGSGPKRSRLVIGPDFDLSAAGVVRLMADAGVLGVGIEFSQPDTAARVNLVPFPPAISGNDQPRVRIERVRISAAHVGIDLRGNAGGSWVMEVEVGAFYKELIIGGAKHTVRVRGFDSWPYGAPDTATGLGQIMQDNQRICIEMGQCDGFEGSGIMAFRSRVLINSAAQGIPFHFTDLKLDGDGACLIQTGDVASTFGAVYCTKSATGTESPIRISAGTSKMAQLDTLSGINASVVLVDGGKLDIAQARANHNRAGTAWAEVTAGELSIGSVEGVVPVGNRVDGFIKQSGTGVLRLDNIRANPRAGGQTGPLISIATPQPGHRIRGDRGNWQFSFPQDLTSGSYGPTINGILPYSPALFFTGGNGDFNPTYSTREGFFWFDENGLHFEGRIAFNTNAYSTASGYAYISPPPYNNSARDQSRRVSIVSPSKIALGSYTQLTGVIDCPTGRLILRRSGSGLTEDNLPPSAFPASTNGIGIGFSGFIPIA